MRRRPSVPPPDRPSVTWEEYINSDPRHPPCLGRQLVAKECNKHFKATIAMVLPPPLLLSCSVVFVLAHPVLAHTLLPLIVLLLSCSFAQTSL